MNTGIRKAFVTELMKLSMWYRSNASIRHGIPVVEPLTEMEKLDGTVTTGGDNQTEVSDPAATGGGAEVEPGRGGVATSPARSRILRAALLALGAAGTLGVGAAINQYLSPSVALPDPQRGSLLQFLEDGGHHLYESDRSDPD